MDAKNIGIDWRDRNLLGGVGGGEWCKYELLSVSAATSEMLSYIVSELPLLGDDALS